MKEKYTFEEAQCFFGGALPPGLSIHRLSDDLRNSLTKASTKLPKMVVEWASENIIFISSNDESPAFVFPNRFNAWVGVVFLSNCILSEPEERQALIIAHEIAHLKLKHKISPFAQLSEEEYQRQEMEASKLAKIWLYQDD